MRETFLKDFQLYGIFMSNLITNASVCFPYLVEDTLYFMIQLPGLRSYMHCASRLVLSLFTQITRYVLYKV